MIKPQKCQDRRKIKKLNRSSITDIISPRAFLRLALSALSAANPRDVLTSRAAKIADQQVYNIRIPFEGGPITNQRSSGRCWLFAATNVFRVALMQKYNLESFELSQAWLFFWLVFPPM